MNIETGKKIHGNRFTELSMPQHIIDRVHALATAEYAPDLDNDGCPIFEWELGAPVDNFDNELPPNIQPAQSTSDDDSEEEDDSDDDDDTDDEDDNENDDELNIKNEDESISSNNPSENVDDEYVNDDESISDNTEIRSDDESIADARSDDDSIADDSDVSVDELRSEIDSENVVEGKRNRTATTQPNVGSFGGKKYHVNMLNIGHDAFARFEEVKLGLYSTAVGICFNQMTAKKGIELFGRKQLQQCLRSTNNWMISTYLADWTQIL
jgi:hypothetical protein